MSRFAKTVVLSIVIVGGLWALVNREQLKHPEQLLGQLKQQLAIAPTNFSSGPDLSSVDVPPPIVPEPVIRIASFKLNGFGTTINDSQRIPMLADICRRYDAIALQGIDGRDDRWLQLLADSLQATLPGSDYAFITDQSQLTTERTQNAILFNRRTLELDVMNWYTVNDPDNLLKRKPLVGWFRTRMKDARSAFTFTLVNCEFASLGSEMELAYLGELFRAIRQDGRGEDDVILAGDFGAGDRGLAPIEQRDGLTWVVSNQPTDVRSANQFDNVVFSPTATIEFTGRGGVFDFLRMFNLRIEEAEQLSQRLPVWAEFSVFEGGQQALPISAHGVRRNSF